VFCEEMLESIKAWEAHPRSNALALVLVAAAAEPTNGLTRLRSRVVLDSAFSAGRAFGLTGTPSAVLIDAQGEVAAPVAIGTPAVIALLGSYN